FGPRLATRPVIKAFAGCLTGDGTPAWADSPPDLPSHVLQAALVAAGGQPPEGLVAVLASPGGPFETTSLLDHQELRAARRLFRCVPVRRARDLLIEAVVAPDGLRLLRDCGRLYDTGVPIPVPDRPRDLLQLHDDLMAHVDAVNDHPLAFPPELLALDGQEVGDGLCFVVPRGTSDLAAWGRHMHNCIASYSRAAVAGRTWLLGVEDGTGLSYNLELSPAGGILQFLGPRNGAPAAAHVRAVQRALDATPLLTGQVRRVVGPDLPPNAIRGVRWWDDWGDELV
ncbi:MAG: PcfJ domain-containing protein, partial [Acidimicrobiia bacterium]